MTQKEAETCLLCKKPLGENCKSWHGKAFHVKCLRKIRKKAKNHFYGDLDAAVKECDQPLKQQTTS